MGFIIESPELAGASAERFDAQVPGNAYEVHLQNGKLQWIERNEGGETVRATEPGTTRWQRAVVCALSWLPIEWML
jgi:putative cardiolipin synthase